MDAIQTVNLTKKYKDTFEIGINVSDLGKIPFYQDSVILGDTERSRNGKIKIAFIIGVNDGIFPAKQASEGYQIIQDLFSKYDVSKMEIICQINQHSVDISLLVRFTRL